MIATAQELYLNSVFQLPMGERLQLAALILNDLARLESATQDHQSVRQMLNEMPAGRLFKTSAEADAYLEGERDSWDR